MIKRVKGDSLTLLIRAGENITGWKIRAEIYTCSSHLLELATSNSGGSDDQIYILDAALGKFAIFIPSGSTTDFPDNANIEVEVDTGVLVGGEPEILTILNEEVLFEKQKITWSTPT